MNPFKVSPSIVRLYPNSELSTMVFDSKGKLLGSLVFKSSTESNIEFSKLLSCFHGCCPILK